MRRPILLIVLVLGIAGWSPVGLAQSGYGDGALPAPAQASLEPGDQIQIRLWQEPQLSGDYPVDESGYVSLPLVGLRKVTDRPASEVKRMLVEEYARQLRNQPAQITILRRIRVLGAVRDPGLYHIDPTMTLGDAIAMAGGVENDGRENSIRIYRDGRVHRARLDRGAGLTTIVSGDEIFVPRKSWMERNATFLLGAIISASAVILTR